MNHYRTPHVIGQDVELSDLDFDWGDIDFSEAAASGVGAGLLTEPSEGMGWDDYFDAGDSNIPGDWMNQENPGGTGFDVSNAPLFPGQYWNSPNPAGGGTSFWDSFFGRSNAPGTQAALGIGGALLRNIFGPAASNGIRPGGTPGINPTGGGPGGVRGGPAQTNTLPTWAIPVAITAALVLLLKK